MLQYVHQEHLRIKGLLDFSSIRREMPSSVIYKSDLFKKNQFILRVIF